MKVCNLLYVRNNDIRSVFERQTQDLYYWINYKHRKSTLLYLIIKYTIQRSLEQQKFTADSKDHNIMNIIQ
jgi:hypothetical protein